jgi:phenylpyruvate tautomerase
MPLLELKTTVALAEGQRQHLLSSLSRMIARDIGKPEQYVMVSLETAPMLMSGQPGPAAFAMIRSIGGLGPAVNRKLAKDLCDLLQREAGIPADRVYLNFVDVPASEWGWNGDTFG